MEAARRAGSTVINVRRIADASRAELSITLYALAENAFISVKYPYRRPTWSENQDLHLLSSDSFIIVDFR